VGSVALGFSIKKGIETIYAPTNNNKVAALFFVFFLERREWGDISTARGGVVIKGQPAINTRTGAKQPHCRERECVKND